MDNNQLKEFLSNIRIGDYIWIKYDSGILRKKVREATGYAAQINADEISLDDVNPFEEARHLLDENFSYNNILEFRKLKESSFLGLESKVTSEKN